jgi:hypothetical protein
LADLTLKQGASLQLAVAATNDDGTPFDLTTVTVSSQVRNQIGQLIATLPIVVTSPPTLGTMTILAPTDGWPIGRLIMDFKLVEAAVVLKSTTLGIVIQQAATA